MKKLSKRDNHLLKVNPDRVKKLQEVGVNFSEKNKKCHNNDAVKKLRVELEKLRLPFIEEHPIVVKYSQFYQDSKLYILDFYIPSPFNLIIEVDGGYHNNPEQVRYDKKRDSLLRMKKTGDTIRLSNETVLSENFDLRAYLPKSSRKAIDYLISLTDIVPDARFQSEYDEFYSLNKSRRKKFFFFVIAEAMSIKWKGSIDFNQSSLTFSPPHKKGKIRLFTYNPEKDTATEHRRGIEIKNAFKWVVSTVFNYQPVNS